MKGKHLTDLAEKHRLWQQRLFEWKESRLSQAEYCRQNRLDPKNFLNPPVSG